MDRSEQRFLPAEEDEGEDADPVPAQAYNFNPDAAWQAYVLRFEPTVKAIAVKYCSTDENLREDVMQEARIALATTFPERVRGHDDFLAGRLTAAEWDSRLQRYLGNVIRNAILSYLDSYPKGNWYIGRSRSVKDRATGGTKKVYLPPRFSSLDELVDNFGAQIDEHGQISWPDPSDDGLPRRRSPASDE